MSLLDLWLLGLEIEGYDGKTLELYHMTSENAANSIVSQQYMKPGSQGMFGPAVYFAETKEACQRKAKHKEVLLIAQVKVGKSLICREASYGLNDNIISDLGCHSVKGVGCVSSVEYAIYNSFQITQIKRVQTFPLYRQVSPRFEVTSDECRIQ